MGKAKQVDAAELVKAFAGASGKLMYQDTATALNNPTVKALLSLKGMDRR